MNKSTEEQNNDDKLKFTEMPIEQFDFNKTISDPTRIKLPAGALTECRNCGSKFHISCCVLNKSQEDLVIENKSLKKNLAELLEALKNVTEAYKKLVLILKMYKKDVS